MQQAWLPSLCSTILQGYHAAGLNVTDQFADASRDLGVEVGQLRNNRILVDLRLVREQVRLPVLGRLQPRLPRAGVDRNHLLLGLAFSSTGI